MKWGGGCWEGLVMSVRVGSGQATIGAGAGAAAWQERPRGAALGSTSPGKATRTGFPNGVALISPKKGMSVVDRWMDGGWMDVKMSSMSERQWHYVAFRSMARETKI